MLCENIAPAGLCAAYLRRKRARWATFRPSGRVFFAPDLLAAQRAPIFRTRPKKRPPSASVCPASG